MHNRLSAILLIGFLFCSILLFSPAVPSAHSTTVDRVLGQDFYFHRELSGISGYRVLNTAFPAYSDSKSITQTVPVGIWEVGDGWVSPEVPRNITLERSYNFLFSVWGAGNGKASLFFKFYAYRNGNEYYLFTSNPSGQLIVNASEMLWQHKTREVTLVIQEGDRLVLRLFIDVVVAGTFGLGYDCVQYPSFVNDPTETRYMRFDSWTVNGLFANILNLTQTTSYATAGDVIVGDVAGYWGVRVWKRSSAGSETEITSGNAIAIVTRPTDDSGIQFSTWACPETALVSTDAIVVRVYQDDATPPTTLAKTFITEQLGASKLNSATWTIWYWTLKSTAIYADEHYTDYNNHTINGLNAHQHITSRNSSSSYTKTLNSATTRTIYMAVRWWKRASGGTETELGASGTYKCITSAAPTVATPIMVSASYSLSETALLSTDAIVVRFYMRFDNNTFVAGDLMDTFISTQLGATKLYATTLTAYYYVSRTGTAPTLIYKMHFGWIYDPFYEDYVPYSYIGGYKYRSQTTLNFRYGTGTYNSQIENFAWTVAVTKSWHDVLWNFNLTARQVNHVYWVQNLTGMEWNHVYWIQNLTAMQWHSVNWILDLPTMAWHSSLWALSLATMGWHSIDWVFALSTSGWHSVYWVFTLGEVSNIPILFVGIAFFGSVFAMILFWRLRKKS